MRAEFEQGVVVPRTENTKSPKPAFSSALLSVLVRGAVTIGLILLGVLIFVQLVRTSDEAKRVTEPLPPRLVQTVVASPRPVPRTWTTYGTARALTSTEISSEVSAIVRERPKHMQPGVFVEQGELIVLLDTHDFELAAAGRREAIVALEAQIDGLDIQEDSMRRRVELADESVILAHEELKAAELAQSRAGVGEIEINRQRRATITLERDAEVQRDLLRQIPPRRAALRAQIELERTQLRLAERNIERCSIASPYAGRLQRVDVQEGERVAPGAAVARLVDLSVIEIPLRVALASSSSIRIGDQVSLRASNDSGAHWNGRVTRIAPEADGASRSITVYAVVEQGPRANGGPLLLPGQFVVGKIAGRLLASALPIPRSAIDEDRVLVVTENGSIDVRRVGIAFYLDGEFPEIDAQERQWAVITSGLVAGDRVVTSNLDELRVGMIVRASGTKPVETARAPNGESEG